MDNDDFTSITNMPRQADQEGPNTPTVTESEAASDDTPRQNFGPQTDRSLIYSVVGGGSRVHNQREIEKEREEEKAEVPEQQPPEVVHPE